jgi:predicted nucleotidyltransferase
MEGKRHDRQPVFQQEPVDIERRRREALAVAERCAQMLTERFRAKRVILFGSLAGDGPWHAGSDIDLAVEGVPSEALRQAEEAIERVVPPWLTVDIVPLERTYSEIRSRILREAAMPDDQHLVLWNRLRDELVALERTARSLDVALERAGAAPDEFSLRALTTYVDDFYKGCERICERVAVALDGGLPQGDRRHQRLLGQMGEHGQSGRPALFSGPLLLDLDEYRRFRHRVRHIYGYELEGERVLTLARAVRPLFERVREAVEQFGVWLVRQAPAAQPPQENG